MRAQEFITEIFQPGKTNWEWKVCGSQEAAADFTVGDRKYQWLAFSDYRNNPTKWEIQFRLLRNDTDPENLDLFGRTGTGNSAQVLSTAVDITREFIKHYGVDKVKEITFNAKEDSRIGLYAKMINRLLPDWNLYQKYTKHNGMQYHLTDRRAYDNPENKTTERQGVTEGRGSGYKEIEFVCANPEFPDATDHELQKQLYAGLQRIPGVIPLFQDQSDYSEGQYSLTAIYKDSPVRGQILKLAKQLGVSVDLEQSVTDDYVDRAVRGEHEGQQGVTENDDQPTPIRIDSNVKARDWIKKVYAAYPQTWQNNHVMPLGGSGDDQQFAMFELVPSMSQRGAVEVKWFQAYPLRQGVGTRAMQELQRLALADGISLTLFPWDKGQVSQSKLIKFYRGQGFSPAKPGSKNMAWSPTGVTENFADGRGPGRPGDSQRHGIPKGATMAQLEKAAKAPGRKGQLARWQLNMRRGRKK
jgi:hypothetical protein